MKKTLGEKIRLLREAKGLCQDELAKKVGLTRETISNIENNHRQIKAEELIRFADLLQISSDQLLGRIPLDEIHLEKSYPPDKTKKASQPGAIGIRDLYCQLPF